MAVSPIHGRNAMVYIVGGTGVDPMFLPSANRWMIRTDINLVQWPFVNGALWMTSFPLPMTWTGTIEGVFDMNDSSPYYSVTGGQIGNPSVGTPPLRSFMALYPVASNGARFYSGLIWPHLTVDVNKNGVGRYILDFTGDGALLID